MKQSKAKAKPSRIEASIELLGVRSKTIVSAAKVKSKAKEQAIPEAIPEAKAEARPEAIPQARPRSKDNERITIMLKCGWCITKHHEGCRIKINTGQTIVICECECKAEAKAEARPEAEAEAKAKAEAQAEATTNRKGK